MFDNLYESDIIYYINKYINNGQLTVKLMRVQGMKKIHRMKH